MTIKRGKILKNSKTKKKWMKECADKTKEKQTTEKTFNRIILHGTAMPDPSIQNRVAIDTENFHEYANVRRVDSNIIKSVPRRLRDRA